MNEEKDAGKIKEEDGRSGASDLGVLALLSLPLIWGANSENSRMNELEKKVARLEGQVSMIGGKRK